MAYGPEIIARGAHCAIEVFFVCFLLAQFYYAEAEVQQLYMQKTITTKQVRTIFMMCLYFMALLAYGRAMAPVVLIHSVYFRWFLPGFKMTKRLTTLR
jgi:hypothetical protein